METWFSKSGSLETKSLRLEGATTLSWSTLWFLVSVNAGRSALQLSIEYDDSQL
jgi:hypothetical protein